jgi:hypothetical protein
VLLADDSTAAHLAGELVRSGCRQLLVHSSERLCACGRSDKGTTSPEQQISLAELADAAQPDFDALSFPNAHHSRGGETWRLVRRADIPPPRRHSLLHLHEGTTAEEVLAMIQAGDTAKALSFASRDSPEPKLLWQSLLLNPRFQAANQNTLR